MIANFENEEHRFLSNFYPVDIFYEDIVYPSVEHAYVAGKTTSKTLREEITQIELPGQVKRYGRKIQLRENWDIIKLPLMEQLVRTKFNREILSTKLLATGDEELVEGNWWGDTFWGVCAGKGQNHLGKILMKIRSDLKEKLNGIISTNVGTAK
jgi:ribA/ribD-fused uncharacterized protein